ncbi:ABC transporter ATP-binding protein [Ruminiclostridium cellobioparum]|nr:ABC transporter ATP-binding protein [Ruminiclostridium cellobioparum]
MLINTENKLILIGLIELLQLYERKISIISVSVCIIASSGISILVPLIGMKITGGQLSAPNCNTVAVLSAAVFGLVFTVRCRDFIETNYYSYIKSVFPFTRLKTAFNHSLKLKLSYFNNTKFAEIMNNINKDISDKTVIIEKVFSRYVKPC